MNKVQNAGELAIEHWNKTPLDVSEQERYRFYPWLYEAAEFRHHGGDRILEIGCGAGVDLSQFVKHQAKSFAIDLTPAHLRLAQERVGSGAQLCRAHGGSIPFGDSTFDYVYSHGVIHHIDQPRRVAGEIMRILRPGGRFNIMVYAWWSLSRFEYMLHHGRDWRLFVENSRDPVHIDFYTRRSLEELFSPAPVTVEKYHCRIPVLEKWLGWFIVAKGTKP